MTTSRLAILSDLHMDINQLDEMDLTMLADVLQESGVTHLHLAGDTANKVQKVLQTVAFIEQHGITVTFNFGNHEMPDVAEQIEDYPDRHFLNLDYQNLNDKLVLLAFSGWYDYSFSVEKDPLKNLATKNLYWYDRFIHREADDPTINREILRKLKLVLDDLAQQQKEVIIATHFVPKKEFIVYQQKPYERWNSFNGFLGSEATGALFDQYSNLELVVFGHTHRRFPQQEINGTLYSCQPFGYYFEWQITRQFVMKNNLMPEFNPMKLRKILKDNQTEFTCYRRLHLKEEFRRALTLWDYSINE
ncbi:metallophosphoesterase [Enterococcus sp. LJL120]